MIDIKEYYNLQNKYYEKGLTKEEKDSYNEYNNYLISEYPFLKIDGIIDESGLSFTWLDDMPKGWRIAFGDNMLKDLKEALIADNALDQYQIVQVKEKYGGLRWYDNWSTERICKVIDKYEKLSYNTCIICGKPAKYITKGWISPYCEDCVKIVRDSYEKI